MKKTWHYCFYLILCFLSQSAVAQTTDNWQIKPQLKATGFIDVFYCYDFNQPTGNSRQPFFFNHNRHNEFNVNLALIQVELEHTNYRAKLAFQAGTYPNDNYSSELGTFKNIGESSIGIVLNKQRNLWLDAGIFASHIGFESAISSDNLTLTRSLVAENLPYFLTGSKITYSPTEKWTIMGLVCNGWQRIKRKTGNSLLSFGSQINYKPNDKLELNWSTFIGTNDPDSTRRIRYFSNLYSKVELTKNLHLVIGFDAGIQQRSKQSSIYQAWVGPVIIAQYAFSEKFQMAARAEYYQDETGIIIQTSSGNNFKTSGFSLNLDYLPQPFVFCRIEGRYLTSPNAVFAYQSGFTSTNFVIAGSIALKFAHKKDE